MKRTFKSVLSLCLFITIYGMNGCGFCETQVKECDRLGITYRYESTPGIHFFPTLVNSQGTRHECLLTGEELIKFDAEGILQNGA